MILHEGMLILWLCLSISYTLLTSLDVAAGPCDLIEKDQRQKRIRYECIMHIRMLGVVEMLTKECSSKRVVFHVFIY